MGNNSDPKKSTAVTINLIDSEGRIEKLMPEDSGSVLLRITCWDQDHIHSRPLVIAEADLALLLQKAIKAGILSPEFLKDLHSEIEI